MSDKNNTSVEDLVSKINIKSLTNGNPASAEADVKLATDLFREMLNGEFILDRIGGDKSLMYGISLPIVKIEDNCNDTIELHLHKNISKDNDINEDYFTEEGWKRYWNHKIQTAKSWCFMMLIKAINTGMIEIQKTEGTVYYHILDRSRINELKAIDGKELHEKKMKEKLEKQNQYNESGTRQPE